MLSTDHSRAVDPIGNGEGLPVQLLHMPSSNTDSVLSRYDVSSMIASLSLTKFSSHGCFMCIFVITRLNTGIHLEENKSAFGMILNAV